MGDICSKVIDIREFFGVIHSPESHVRTMVWVGDYPEQFGWPGQLAQAVRGGGEIRQLGGDVGWANGNGFDEILAKGLDRSACRGRAAAVKNSTLAAGGR